MLAPSQVNIYRGTSFGNVFQEYAKVSSKPLLIGEYGIDAYNARSVVSGEDQDEHADGTIKLVEELERNAVSCLVNCVDDDTSGPPVEKVASGGFIMSWVDELWKGKSCGPDAGPSNGYCGRYCPDSNPEFQSPCGLEKPGFPDGWMNEEYWGLMGSETACYTAAQLVAGDVLPDRMVPRLAFVEVGAPPHCCARGPLPVVPRLSRGMNGTDCFRRVCPLCPAAAIALGKRGLLGVRRRGQQCTRGGRPLGAGGLPDQLHRVRQCHRDGTVAEVPPGAHRLRAHGGRPYRDQSHTEIGRAHV